MSAGSSMSSTEMYINKQMDCNRPISNHLSNEKQTGLLPSSYRVSNII